MRTTRKKTKTTRPRRAPRRAPAKATEMQQLRNVWLAGLGALATAGESANALVDVLIAKGKQREPRARAAAARLVKRAQATADELASETQRRTRQAVDGAFERLGVAGKPRQKNLLHRLGDLAEAIL
jgi:poly(hydroxyalkanoate) granule-associated protein